MITTLEIRGKSFRLNDIESLTLQWDYESKINHMTIALLNGDVADFLEEDMLNPNMGELYLIKKRYEKIAHLG